MRQPVTMFRVSSCKPNRGPLNPRGLQIANPVDRNNWSRFDVGPPATPPPDLGLTIYGASRRDTSFVEVLAWKAATSKTFAGLYEEAQFTGTSIDQLLADLRAAGAPIGQVARNWRTERKIYELQTPNAIWIDPTVRQNLQIIAGMTGQFLGSHRRLTVSDLTGDDRMITTTIAELLRNIIITNEHGASDKIFGIRYRSKFGSEEAEDYCWAAWLTAPNESVSIIDSSTVDPDDPDLRTASRITGVHVP